jgi:predicted RNase H-like HicB family nuclease
MSHVGRTDVRKRIVREEVPGVFSQGETLEELEENIEDAYKLLMDKEIKTIHPA